MLMASLYPGKEILHSHLSLQFEICPLATYNYTLPTKMSDQADALSCRVDSPILHHLHMPTVTI